MAGQQTEGKMGTPGPWLAQPLDIDRASEERLMAAAPQLLSLVKRWSANEAEMHPNKAAFERRYLEIETDALVAKIEGRS